APVVIQFEPTFVDLAVGLLEPASSRHHAVAELAFVDTAVGGAHPALAGREAVRELAFVDRAVRPLDAAAAVELAVDERPVVAADVGSDRVRGGGGARRRGEPEKESRKSGAQGRQHVVMPPLRLIFARARESSEDNCPGSGQREKIRGQTPNFFSPTPARRARRAGYSTIYFDLVRQS